MRFDLLVEETDNAFIQNFKQRVKKKKTLKFKCDKKKRKLNECPVFICLFARFVHPVAES